MNALGSQWLGGIFTLQYTTLKLTVLLHETALINFPMATIVDDGILETSTVIQIIVNNSLLIYF